MTRGRSGTIIKTFPSRLCGKSSSFLMNYVWKEEKFTKTPNDSKYTAIMEASARRITKCTYIEFIVSIAITKMLNETKCEWWDKCW